MPSKCISKTAKDMFKSSESEKASKSVRDVGTSSKGTV